MKLIISKLGTSILVFSLLVLVYVDTPAQRYSEWSTPENLRPAVNSSRFAGTPFVTKNGYYQYLGPNRVGYDMLSINASGGSALALLAAAFILFLLAEFVLHLLYGNAYVRGASYLRVLVWVLPVQGARAVARQLLFAWHRQREHLWALASALDHAHVNAHRVARAQRGQICAPLQLQQVSKFRHNSSGTCPRV